jgi:transglutaminase-like putative cysteine protease
MACFSSALPAQFQDPTKDELAMTADAKAPGASTVCLYREDVTDQVSRSRSYYERIKVLTDKGKEMATINVPYVTGIERVVIDGRTIHADGTIVPLTDKPTDLADVQTKGFERSVLVFSLPSVEVGSILEYRVTIRTTFFPEDPVWMIQQPYFVHKAHYAFKTLNFAKFGYVSRLGGGAKLVDDMHGSYTLDLADIPALPDDDWMPPINTIQWRVSFFRSRFSSTQQFWDVAEKDWATFVNEFTRTTGTLKSAVKGMIAPGDSETLKAQKIYATVMKLENTDFTRHKSVAERKKEKIKDIRIAQDVWKEQSGSSDELALLYVALCRAGGLNVEPMKVVDRSRALFDEAYLSSRQLDDYIAVGQLDGKTVYLDPGEKLCPFGMLDWRHALTYGFLLTDKSAVIARSPAGGSSWALVQRVAFLTIDGSGNVQGTVRVILSGQDALRWRQFAIENDEEEVKKAFNEWMNTSLPEGIRSDFDHFLALDQYDTDLLGFVRVSGSLGAVTGNRIILPGFFFESKSRHPFVEQEKRTVPVEVQYARTTKDDVTYNLPLGYKVESNPQTNKIDWPDRANLSISTSIEADSVEVTWALACGYAMLDAKEYDSLRGFYQKLAVADQQQVVLVRAPLAKAN